MKKIIYTAVILTMAMLLSCGSQTEEPSDTGLAGGSLFPPKEIPTISETEDTGTELLKDGKGEIMNVEWELVWSDEFDYEGKPDPQKWGYDIGGSGWGNNELQYYTEGENAYVSDGVLRIEARKENYKGKEYTSTRLISKNKGDWLYGRFEVSVKLPAGRGTWPAVWMLPTDWVYGNWPRSGEIDIMEHVGYEPNVIHGTVHTDRYNHKKGTHIGESKYIEGVLDSFHTYAVEWYEDKILFFIDDTLYHRFSPFVYTPDPGFQEWPFDKRFHLLINIAVGGDWGGAQGVADDIWPAVMEVDYVRVYQQK
jgi:beta-glucanase (GH16 family)